MNIMKKKAFFPTCLILILPVLCCLMLFSIFTAQYGYQKLIAEPVFREKLGITADYDSVRDFLRKELIGLSIEDGLDNLDQWGDIEHQDCPLGVVMEYGVCNVKIYHFLDTRMDYEFFIVHRDNVITMIYIEID